MRLFAISDLHVGHPANAKALSGLKDHKNDWLLVVGDIGESFEHLEFTLDQFLPHFGKVFWTPGNHELWTVPGSKGPDALEGVERYLAMVDVCRKRGVVTPEDPYVEWPGETLLGTERKRCFIAPMFLLYDYSFRPDDVPFEKVHEWAEEQGISCTDEVLLKPAPYPSVVDWCHARVRDTEKRLLELPQDSVTVLVNHFPLKRDHAWLPLVPRFTPWCGTRLTHDWHTRFRAISVVGGHIHIRATRVSDGVRFEEVSFGYPRDRRGEDSVEAYLRRILPAKPAQSDGQTFHRGLPGIDP